MIKRSRQQLPSFVLKPPRVNIENEYLIATGAVNKERGPARSSLTCRRLYGTGSARLVLDLDGKEGVFHGFNRRVDNSTRWPITKRRGPTQG